MRPERFPSRWLRECTWTTRWTRSKVRHGFGTLDRLAPEPRRGRVALGRPQSRTRRVTGGLAATVNRTDWRLAAELSRPALRTRHRRARAQRASSLEQVEHQAGRIATGRQPIVVAACWTLCAISASGSTSPAIIHCNGRVVSVRARSTPPVWSPTTKSPRSIGVRVSSARRGRCDERRAGSGARAGERDTTRPARSGVATISLKLKPGCRTAHRAHGACHRERCAG